MAGYQETTCPICGTIILDLNLSDNEGVFCYSCYRNLIAREEPVALREG
jgi:hypothetical protein